MNSVDELAVEALKNNLFSYSQGLSDAEISRVKTTSESFISFLSRTNEADGAKHLSEKLSSWKEAFYRESERTERSSTDSIRSLFRYIRSLRRSKKFPEIIIPNSSRNLIKTPQLYAGRAPVEILPNKTKTPNPYIFRPPTGNSEIKGYKHDLNFLDVFSDGEVMAACFKEFQTGYSYSFQARNFNAFKAFIKFSLYGYSLNRENRLNKTFMTKFIHEHVKCILLDRRTKETITLHSDIRALRRVYIHFARKHFFASVKFPNPLKGLERHSSALKTNHKLLSQSLAKTTRKDERGEEIRSAFSMIEAPDDEFLLALERDERLAFNMIREACIKEARRVIYTFEEGQRLIAKCDIEYIRKIYQQTGRLIDPNVKGSNDHQALSFFSPAHPNGLANLLGYIWHEYNGLGVRQAFPGSSFLNHYGAKKIKDWLGLNSHNSLPFFVIIVGETGVNITSLENAKISDEHDNNLILNSTNKAGFEQFEVRKPRARKSLEKYIKIANVPQDIDELEINAHTCLSYTLKMTAQYRKYDDSKHLWIGPYFCAPPYAATRISASAFKSQLKRLVDTNLSFASTDNKYFTRANIRVSASILIWFESGGDAQAVAQFLGNTVSTSNKSYIPVTLQEALHRRNIRKFQNALIVASTNQSTSLTDEALPELDKSQISKIIAELTDSDLDLNPFDVSDQQEDLQIDEGLDRKALVVSAQNIAFLKLINDTILELRLANPAALEMKIANRGREFWIELWNLTNLRLRNSPDRALRRVFHDGLALASRLELDDHGL